MLGCFLSNAIIPYNIASRMLSRIILLTEKLNFRIHYHFIKTEPVQFVCMKAFCNLIKRNGDYLVSHISFLEKLIGADAPNPKLILLSFGAK